MAKSLCLKAERSPSTHFLQRIHPAQSRINKLAEETPGLLIVFDLLADQDSDLIALPLAERRERLGAFAKSYFPNSGKILLSPFATKISEAKRWLAQVGATLDGIIAKRRDMPYSS